MDRLARRPTKGGVIEVAPGLRRWTVWHEEWKQDVGCVAVETRDGLVLIDPLEPPDKVRRADHVLITVFWHWRSTRELGAKRVWALARSARPLGNRGVDVTDTFRPGDELPGGVQAFQTARLGEVVYWLPEQRALVIGDVLLDSKARPAPPKNPRGPLRLCRERWLGKATHGDLRDSLRPLLALPVERVLVSHGDPVLREAKRALELALEG